MNTNSISKFIFAATILFLAGVKFGKAHTFNHLATVGNASIYWYHESDSEIQFRIECRTKKWIGFGFNSKPNTQGADFVVIWTDKNGYLMDLNIMEKDKKTLDKVQDYELISSVKNGTKSTITVRRKLNTCDKEDYQFSQDTSYILFQSADEEPKLDKGGKFEPPSATGVESFYAPALILNEATSVADYELDVDPLRKLYWDVRIDKFVIPKDKDVERCQYLEIPEKYTGTKHQIIGWERMITHGNEDLVHHTSILLCNIGPEACKTLIERGNYDCSSVREFAAVFECSPIIAPIAASAAFYPNQTGFVLGSKYKGPDCIVLQTHYLNQDFAENRVDSSGVRLFLTDTPREHDAGTLIISAKPTHGHTIPPGKPNFIHSSACPSECTNLLPQAGVTAFQFWGHMHEYGAKITMRHADSQGIEKQPIYTDNNFNAHYPEIRSIELRKVLPGDILDVNCEYNTGNAKKSIIGGIDVLSNEMCIGLLFIYPRPEQISGCGNELSRESQASFFGIKKYNEESLVVIDPPSLANKTFLEVIDKHDWKSNSIEKMNEFQKVAASGPKHFVCKNARGEIVKDIYDTIKITKPWVNVEVVCKKG